ncbi:hypothetical protein DSAG12_03917 [Promethearchaeum syntrophicum]|uniref:HTH marR-type domain-containing protein n=1 Tax=Promethearchaeum syntrophicum TaxID=2594042 RepID=A0A5B9DFI8_9ARCH|nr:hypothetical protein [Candidatus Prometheoarchaeum syntrophicum]QEE18079.1 hypothetical protein DSAG12_03917 [Candidatus Prometheoarchaeum syntrophicum]
MSEDVEIIFRDVEKKLIRIITEMSYQKGRSTTFSTITAYAYVREKVTQKILQKITGFSRSTISNTLAKLVQDEVLVKQYNSESREYIYQIKGTLASILGASTANFDGYFSKIGDKLNEVESKLNQEGMKTKQGYENIQDFISKMKILMPAYEHVMKKYQIPKSSEKKVD